MVLTAWTTHASIPRHVANLTLFAHPETIQTALASAVTADSVMSYSFDARNQLRQVTDQPGATAQRLQSTYYYYPDGRRAEKIVTQWNGSSWQPYRTCQYIYNQWNLIREIVSNQTGVVTRDFSWGLDLTGISDGQWGQKSGGIGGLLAITEVTGTKTNIFLPVCDHVGTVHALVAAVTNNVALSTPAVVATYEYSPFGELIAQDGPYAGSCPFGFSSKYRDSETGLIYYGYRFYDPRCGKWLTSDPLEEDGGLNLTAYCSNDPLNNTDNLGLSDAVEDENGVLVRANDPAFLQRENQKEWNAERSQTVEAALDNVARNGTSMGIGFTPAGSIQSGVELISGRDYITGGQVSRGWAAVGVVAGVIPAGKGIVRAIAKGSEEIAQAGQAISKVSTVEKAVVRAAQTVTKTTAVGELRAQGLKDAHHIIQDAAVRNLPGYSTELAPGMRLLGPATRSGTPHNLATIIQRQAGGGTYAAERRIAYKALRNAGIEESNARALIEDADLYFEGIGITPETLTRIPGNR